MENLDNDYKSGVVSIESITEDWAKKGLDLNLARSRSVMIGVPVYRDVSPFHLAAMIQTVSLLNNLGIDHEVRILAGVPVTDARNGLANGFWNSTRSDLIFIDADQGWSPWDVVRLLASGLPLVAGVGRKKSSSPDEDLASWCFLPLDHSGTVPITDAGMVEVNAVGTGFMLINKSVFREMRERRPEWERRGMGSSHKEDFFEFFACDLDVESGRRQGEDISFCHRWRVLGGRVFIDPSIAIDHYGTHNYGGSVARFFDHPAIAS